MTRPWRQTSFDVRFHRAISIQNFRMAFQKVVVVVLSSEEADYAEFRIRRDDFVKEAPQPAVVGPDVG